MVVVLSDANANSYEICSGVTDLRLRLRRSSSSAFPFSQMKYCQQLAS